MSPTAGRALALALVALASWGIPWLGMRAIVPALSTGGRMHPNYRGRPVFLGLGVVWVLWVLGITLLNCVSMLVPSQTFGGMLSGPVALAVWIVPVCFALGFIDDVFGSSDEKGLGGHLRALRQGRLTTGALKLLGIGLVSLQVALGARLAWDRLADRDVAQAVIEVLLATVVIAGFANLVNLLDLRPGRALKGYLGLGLAAWLLWVLTAGQVGSPWGPDDVFGTAGVLVAFAGPALAVWPYDLGEKGMLGDAGANPAGAFIGVILAVALPAWGLALAAVLVVAANLASERVSFSAVIERNPALAWLDGLGRSAGRTGMTVSAHATTDEDLHEASDR